MAKLNAKELVEVLTTMTNSEDREKAELVMRRKVSEQAQLAYIEPIFKIAPLEILRNYVGDIEDTLLRAERGERELWVKDGKVQMIDRLSDEGGLMSLVDGKISREQGAIAVLLVASIESLAESVRT